MLFFAVFATIAAFTAAQPIDNCATLVPGIPDNVGPFCQNCEDGFLNLGNECMECATDNCKVCQPPMGEMCTQCIHPYTLADGACQFLICVDGELVEAVPIIDGANPCGPNCEDCPADDEPFCQECAVGFWNDNGYCKPCCVEGCAVCQPPTGLVCTQCIDDNLPAVDGEC